MSLTRKEKAAVIGAFGKGGPAGEAAAREMVRSIQDSRADTEATPAQTVQVEQNLSHAALQGFGVEGPPKTGQTPEFDHGLLISPVEALRREVAHLPLRTGSAAMRD